MKIQISKGQAMTKELLAKILDLHRVDEARKTKLYNYYVGNQVILNRVLTDTSKPNNKIAHPYGNYITDTVSGYFMGQPITYNADSPEAVEFVAQLKEIFEYNDEQSENIELTKESSKVGTSYELMYLDEQADIRFTKLDARYSIPVYSNTLDEELIYFIRYYGDNLFDASSTTIEVYGMYDVNYYHMINESLTYVSTQPHSFGMVPVSIFDNNAELIGDYELVISLIDAYDKLNSDSVNDFEQFADAYLTLTGMDGTDAEDISAMKDQRVLLIPNDGKAEWLTKDINDTYFQNTVNNLDSDIHKFAKVPNMMDKEFGSNLSGVAIKWKLMGLENKVAIKESHFKKGIQRRLELITSILAVMGTQYDYKAVDIQFHRNLPVNELEAVQMAQAVSGLVSDETMLSLLPFVQDASKELDKRNAQMDTIIEPISTETSSVGDVNGVENQTN